MLRKGSTAENFPASDGPWVESTDECSRIVQAQIRQIDGRQESSILGTSISAPVAKAALANGVAGHAMDYDDTQLSTSKEAVYGLLTHPTAPALPAALAISP